MWMFRARQLQRLHAELFGGSTVVWMWRARYGICAAARTIKPARMRLTTAAMRKSST